MIPLSASFMTDVLAMTLACMVATVPLVATRGRPVPGPVRFALLLAALTAAGYVGGTIRQIVWLIASGLLAGVGLTNKGGRRAAATLAGAGLLGAALLFMRWFARQDYMVQERLGSGLPALLADPPGTVALIVQLWLKLALMLLPVAFVAPTLWVPPTRRGWAMLAALAALAVAGLYLALGRAALAPFTGNLVTEYSVFGDDGLLPGHRPLVWPMPVRLAATALTLGLVFGLLGTLLRRAERRVRRPAATPATGTERPGLDTADWVLLATVVGYAAVVALRVKTPVGGVFDRYWLPVLPVAGVLLLRLAAGRDGAAGRGGLRLARGWAAILAVGVYGTAATHDYFAVSEARVRAVESLRSRGVPRDHIVGGFEYDGMTQLIEGRYLNDPRLTRPPGAYRPPVPGAPPPAYWFLSLTLAIDPAYMIAFSPVPGYESVGPLTVGYRTWVPWSRRHLLVLRRTGPP